MVFVKSLFKICLLMPIALTAMTLEEKIGQLFVVSFYAENAEDVRNLLRDNHIGGILCMNERVQALGIEGDIWAFQDAEYGIGMRLKDVPPLPRNLTLGAIRDEELLRGFGREVARQCRSVGLIGGFAPVVDVLRLGENPVIGRRSFGDDPENVSRCGLAVMEGMREGGILACAKHFPGHGNTVSDSHVDLPVLGGVDLEPFQALIDGGVDMVMVGHLLYPPLSDKPCSLSHACMTKLLREEMGFQGLVVTDALNMKALSDRYSMEEIAVKALLAGADLLVLEQCLDAVPRMIERIRDEVPEELIEEKVARILSYKRRPVVPIPEEVLELRRDLYRAAVTQIGEVQGASSIALVQSRPDPDFENALRQYAEVTVFSYEEMKPAVAYPCVVVNIREGDRPLEMPEGAIVALFDALATQRFSLALVGYEDVLEAKEAVADALFGKLTPLGKLPIRLCKEMGVNDGRESSK